MKQSIWIINNYLLWLLLVVLVALNITKQVPPALKLKTYSINQEIQKKKLEIPVYIDRIIKNDIFNTYSEIPPTIAVKKSLVTPIPQIKQAQITPPPQPKKQTIVPPLQTILKGIVLSSDETKSIVIFEDETKKEKIYHLGEKIKDAQLIKIARNKVILLRANGQQEIHMLRKEQIPFGGKKEEEWKYIINKIDNRNFEIDPIKFRKKIPSLSYLIEELSLGTAFSPNKTLGIKIGKIMPNKVGSILGFQQNDIIKSINNKSVSQNKNRLKIYKDICKMEEGDTIKLTLNRNNSDTIINYKLITLEKPISFTSIPQNRLNTNKNRQREKVLKNFSKKHNIKEKHKQTIAEMRRRWLEKIKKRSPNTRFR